MSVYLQRVSQSALTTSATTEARPSPPPTREISPPSRWAGASLRLQVLDFLFSHYPSFQSQHLDQHLVNYRRYLDTYGPPDILIVGSSRALQGIHPQQLQQALAAQGYPRVKVYNFGINGATAQVVALVLQQVLPPDQLPDVILWGDGLRAFNSGRTDKTFQAIQNSRAYEFLQAGLRPLLSHHPALPAALCGGDASRNTAARTNHRSHHVMRSLWQSQQQKLRRDWQQTVAETPLTELKNWNLTGIPDFLRQPCPNFLETPPTNIPISMPPSGSKTPDTWGFVAVSQQFRPEPYYQNYPKVPGKYDGDYQPFQLQGPQTQALRSVLNFARGRHIPVIVVNLPLSQPYLDATRRQYQAKFRQFMQQQAEQYNFIFRDLSQRWVNEYQYFEDPSHLNRYGAAAVAQQLASDRTIGWSSLLQDPS